MNTKKLDKPFIFFSIIYLGLLAYLKPWDSLFSDQLLKFHQAYSMLHSGFLSENLIYPSLDLDPNYNYFLWRAPMVFQIGERMIGQYPIFLTLLIAPILTFGWIPLISIYMGVINLASAFILRKYWNFSLFWIVFAFFGTYIFLMGPELSEHPPLLFLELSALTLFYKAKDNIRNKCFAGVLLGLGVWLRLEVIVFYFLFWASGWFVYGKSWWKRSFGISFVFSLTVLLLLLFHTLDYNHPIGPRFFQNFNTGKDEGSVWHRAYMILIGKYSMPGLILYLPVLVPLLILYLNKNYRNKLEAGFLHLAITSYSFCVLIAFLAPNDGVSNWGPRYVGLGLFPFVLVLREIWTSLDWKIKSSKLNSVFSILVLYSFVMTVAGFVYYKRTTKEMNSIRSVYSNYEADTYLFLDDMLCGSVGLAYFQKKVLCIQSETSSLEIQNLLGKISRKTGGTVGFISYGDNIKEYASKLPETENRGMMEYRKKVLEEAEMRPIWLENMEKVWKLKQIKPKGIWEYREYEIPKQ